jgi:hypothetical protein
MIWDLADLADDVLEYSFDDVVVAYLTSAKPAGKSAMRAPPNSSVDLKVDILMLILREK